MREMPDHGYSNNSDARTENRNGMVEWWMLRPGGILAIGPGLVKIPNPACRRVVHPGGPPLVSPGREPRASDRGDLKTGDQSNRSTIIVMSSC